jgi:hypothetical protein
MNGGGVLSNISLYLTPILVTPLPNATSLHASCRYLFSNGFVCAIGSYNKS